MSTFSPFESLIYVSGLDGAGLREQNGALYFFEETESVELLCGRPVYLTDVGFLELKLRFEGVFGRSLSQDVWFLFVKTVLWHYRCLLLNPLNPDKILTTEDNQHISYLEKNNLRLHADIADISTILKVTNNAVMVEGCLKSLKNKRENYLKEIKDNTEILENLKFKKGYLLSRFSIKRAGFFLALFFAQAIGANIDGKKFVNTPAIDILSIVDKIYNKNYKPKITKIGKSKTIKSHRKNLGEFYSKYKKFIEIHQIKIDALFNKVKSNPCCITTLDAVIKDFQDLVLPIHTN